MTLILKLTENGKSIECSVNINEWIYVWLNHTNAPLWTIGNPFIKSSTIFIIWFMNICIPLLNHQWISFGMGDIKGEWNNQQQWSETRYSNSLTKWMWFLFEFGTKESIILYSSVVNQSGDYSNNGGKYFTKIVKSNLFHLTRNVLHIYHLTSTGWFLLQFVWLFRIPTKYGRII